MRRGTQRITLRISKRVAPTQLKTLFRAAGWTEDLARYSDQKLRRKLSRSHLVVTAWNAKRLVGFASVISDGALCALVDNLVVHPDHRKRGAGTSLLRRVSDELSRQKVKYVFILGTRGWHTREFFERAGFQSLSWNVFLHTR